MLTLNEKMLCADVLNGCDVWLTLETTDWLEVMTGAHYPSDDVDDASLMVLESAVGAAERIRRTGRILSGLEHEIYDGIKLNGLDAKWEVSGDALMDKLSAMNPSDKEKLIRCIAGVWTRCDENFERDLEALEV